MPEVDSNENRKAGTTVFIPHKLWSRLCRKVCDVERTGRTVRVDGVWPGTTAWLVLSNVAGEMVGWDAHHIHRGLVGGDGAVIRRAFLLAIERLQDSGYHTAEQAEKDPAWLTDASAAPARFGENGQ